MDKVSPSVFVKYIKILQVNDVHFDKKNTTRYQWELSNVQLSNLYNER